MFRNVLIGWKADRGRRVELCNGFKGELPHTVYVCAVNIVLHFVITFVNFFRQFHHLYMPAFFVQKLFRQLFPRTRNIHVTRKKLPKWHSYKKFVRLTLMKLTPGSSALLHKFFQKCTSNIRWNRIKQLGFTLFWAIFGRFWGISVKCVWKFLIHSI